MIYIPKNEHHITSHHTHFFEIRTEIEKKDSADVRRNKIENIHQFVQR